MPALPRDWYFPAGRARVYRRLRGVTMGALVAGGIIGAASLRLPARMNVRPRHLTRFHTTGIATPRVLLAARAELKHTPAAASTASEAAGLRSAELLKALARFADLD